jgi:hypothetical protein
VQTRSTPFLEKPQQFIPGNCFNSEIRLIRTVMFTGFVVTKEPQYFFIHPSSVLILPPGIFVHP